MKGFGKEKKVTNTQKKSNLFLGKKKGRSREELPQGSN